MTSKSHTGHLIWDGALGWLLKEIQATLAQLEKERTRPRLYTNYLEENQTVAGDGVTNHKRQRQDYSKDGVKDFQTASELSRLKNPRRFYGATVSEI
ncbi:hypothetical protein Tco_1026801 [Tanacetum coccineum]